MGLFSLGFWAKWTILATDQLDFKGIIGGEPQRRLIDQ